MLTSVGAVFNAAYSALLATNSSILFVLLKDGSFFDITRSTDNLYKAANELLRFICPAQGTARYATTYIYIGDKLIHKHDAVFALFGAANRYPIAFRQPDELLLNRTSKYRNLAFGMGSHLCIGMSIALLWTEHSIKFWHSYLAGVKQKGEEKYMRSATLRNLTDLPICFRN